MLVGGLLLFVVVTVHRTRRPAVERLDAMDIFDVRLHGSSAGIYVVFVEVIRCACPLEMLAHAAFEAIGQQLQHSIGVPVTQRIVSRRDCGTEIASGWFQPYEWRTLACAMGAHERFKEISVRQLAGLRAQFPNLLSVVKGPLDLCFVGLLDPDEGDLCRRFRAPSARLERRGRQVRRNALPPSVRERLQSQ